MKFFRLSALLTACSLLVCVAAAADDKGGCFSMLRHGFRPIATDRSGRFLGKVQERTARCRGGEKALEDRALPWLDWPRYWGVGDLTSLSPRLFSGFPVLGANAQGVEGALLDLEYQRIELLKFNLFDNSGTYEEYVDRRGPARKVWSAMRLPQDHPSYADVGGGGDQLCRGELIRHRNLNGTCNDIRNPAMGSTGMLFARNVEFEATFPDLGKNELARNRHGERLDMLRPDPQLISRELFTRSSTADHNCKVDFTRDVYPNDAQLSDTNCDYVKAPFFNVLAAFWIQFMTHDWFSHLTEGENDTSQMMKMGAVRPDDVVDRSNFGDRSDPATFTANGRQHLSRAYRTTRNTNTAWWDASQIYGFDERSRRRVKRDSRDGARLAMRDGGYLPLFDGDDPIRPEWRGQEAVAFADNWSIGMSFFHNLFAREHNLFVDEFRRQTASTPEADSGLRDPVKPNAVIRYKDVSDDELFEAARLVVAAEIAKIHTTEWTPQLLYNEPLYRAMNANWSGLFAEHRTMKRVMNRIVDHLAKSQDPRDHTLWYSVFASGAGIFGLGNHDYQRLFFRRNDRWSVTNPDHVNGGVNHFGSPFNFPEEFVTVYRLHPLLPDLIDYRDSRDANRIAGRIALASTVRANASASMENRGLANWALSFGRQRLGALTLGNHPRFLQNLSMPRLGEGKTIDILALDLIRDRERGVPRFNEFRRQYGLQQLRSFDDLIDASANPDDIERQQGFAAKLRSIYGQHKCDASKIITSSQLNADGTRVNDCLGNPDGSMVDNIEDLDTIVGWLAEPRRPHGFAISETQFQVFILNASRRLFSDRFFTSSFRPEFYTALGVRWVTNNGPGDAMYERQKQNGHRVEVSPLKRILMRTIPELQPELAYVANAFDPWARDRGQYYTVAWKPRRGAESDPAFAP